MSRTIASIVILFACLATLAAERVTVTSPPVVVASPNPTERLTITPAPVAVVVDEKGQAITLQEAIYSSPLTPSDSVEPTWPRDPVVAACYDSTDDCSTRGDYVCDQGGLTPGGHGGKRTATLAAGVCSIVCSDGTTATCVRA